MGGVLFSALCSDAISCGASTAIYGLIGSYAALLIVNWTYFKEHSEKKCQILMFILVSLLLTIIVSITGKQIDQLGHLGGLFTGILFGLCVMPQLGDTQHAFENHEKNKRISLIRQVGAIATLIWFGLFLILFYTVREVGSGNS